MSSNHTVVPMSEADPIFGRLTWDSLAFLHEPILMVTFLVAAIVGVVVLGAMIKYKLFKPLWTDWLTSVDHKKIGIMYIVVAVVMLIRGFADALMMTSHQALAVTQSFEGAGYLPPEHYDQVFTAHGVIMIFFVATPLAVGLMNIVVPLQIGARDVAFPMLNSLSFWLFMTGVILTMISLFLGEFAATGWLAYVPLSGLELSPWVGVDYWIWALQISGLGSTLTAVNFVVTILKMRAPGMTLWKMPMFTWTSLAGSGIAVLIFPLFAATIAMLTLDRYVGTHFFTTDLGGNQMMWVNLVWAWGHPEVYFLLLPALGVMADVTSTFSRKRLFGYVSMVWATLSIMILSFIVWLHHFFTMGSGASVNAFFGIMTMMIGIPTGVKLFNYIFTMYRGRVEFNASMWWVVAVLVTFTIGGMTGVMHAIPTNDFVLHNSMFLVAHFHNVLVGGVVFGLFAGVTYWYPKAMGHKLDEKLGKWACALWVIGFFIAWMPKYFAGLDGMTRRLNYIADTDLQPLLYLSFFGALIILVGIILQLINFVISYIRRDQPEYRDDTGDPWGARTLEWSMSSPPPHYNFATNPSVEQIDDYWYRKQDGKHVQPASYTPIHMPKYTSAGVFIGLFSTVFGFAMVWYIWWLAAISFIGMFVVWFMFSFNKDRDYYVQVDEIEADEARYWKNYESQNS
ncbi:MAG: cytochrome o ubiquinol oxidase subunit I [Gammaproteobacteria bacterium]|nr:MAG: cytochrome o ubiquinol oxidase subunit I [Gammaproteobacteria bacterium]